MNTFTHEQYLKNSDFGFEFVDIDDQEVIQKKDALTNSKLDDQNKQISRLQKRLDMMYNAILPLLKNLSEKPEKKYIMWADRIDKIEKFKKQLDDIYKGVL